MLLIKVLFLTGLTFCNTHTILHQKNSPLSIVFSFKKSAYALQEVVIPF
jgi:hypothetical protein